MFGYNPAIPNVFEAQAPALENTSVSKMVATNLTAMHEAREQFVKSEASERIRRALRHNVREGSSQDVQNGDEVFYKRDDSNEWRGPGVVIGRDGKQLLVRHGGVYVRVHVCRLARTPVPLTAEGAETSGDVTASDHRHADHSLLEDVAGEQRRNEEEPIVTETTEVEAESASSGNSSENVEQAVAPVDSTSTVNNFKVGQRIRAMQSDSGEVICGTILSRAGKVTGKYKNAFNVKKNDNTVAWFDFGKDLTEIEVLPNEVELLVLFNSDDVILAKEQEIENWKTNDVYEEVDSNGETVISVRWVITEKMMEGKQVLKARLVARGFVENTDFLRKDSPACSKEAVRLMIAISVSKQWQCHSLDVKAAYLQGGDIEREVYLKPPPEYFNGKIWKLKKTVYGLCDAARAWYLRVRDELLKLGVQASSHDSALFSWTRNGNLEGIICVYVDDFLFAGSEIFYNEIITKLQALFLVGAVEQGVFKYVGLKLVNSPNGDVTLDQCEYAATINKIPVTGRRAAMKTSDLSEEEKTEYRSLVGQLNWIATQTRPDILFDVCELSVNFQNATVEHLLRLNKVVDRIHNHQVRINFPSSDMLNVMHLECYSDASFGNLAKSASMGGFVIFLKDKNGKSSPLYWQAKKIRRVVKSTIAAETLALLDCAEAAVYIANILQDLTGIVLKICCRVDNKSLVDSLYSSKNVEDRRLRIDIDVLQDMIERKEIAEVSWVATQLQLANCLTKRGASTTELLEAISR